MQMVDRVAAAEPMRTDVVHLLNYSCFLVRCLPVGSCRLVSPDGGGRAGGMCWYSMLNACELRAAQEATLDVGPHLRPVLYNAVEHAKDKRRVAMRHFVARTVGKHFGVLLNFIDRVHHLTEKLSAEEVPYQVGCSISDFRKMVKSATALMEESTVQMAKAVAAQLGVGSPVQRDALEACKSLVLSRYKLLEAMARTCYPSDAAAMISSGQVAELLGAVCPIV
jgi:hypothetical protein